MNKTMWNVLREQLLAKEGELKKIVGGPQNYGKFLGIGEALELMVELEETPPRARTQSNASTPETRTVLGTGVFNEEPYEVVRYIKAKKYWIEPKDGNRREINFSEAIQFSQNANLGQPGGSAFDAEWTRRQTRGFNEASSLTAR